MRGDFRTSHVQQGYNTLITWSGSYSVWGPPHVKWVLYPCCTCNVHLSFSILNCTICTYFDIDLKRLYSSEGDLLVSVDANLFGVDSLGWIFQIISPICGLGLPSRPEYDNAFWYLNMRQKIDYEDTKVPHSLMVSVQWKLHDDWERGIDIIDRKPFIDLHANLNQFRS
jgi:hypothetical protein